MGSGKGKSRRAASKPRGMPVDEFVKKLAEEFPPDAVIGGAASDRMNEIIQEWVDEQPAGQEEGS